MLLAAFDVRPELPVLPTGMATAATSPSDVVTCSESDSSRELAEDWSGRELAEGRSDRELAEDCSDMAQRSARISRRATADNLVSP